MTRPFFHEDSFFRNISVFFSPHVASLRQPSRRLLQVREIDVARKTIVSLVLATMLASRSTKNLDEIANPRGVNVLVVMPAVKSAEAEADEPLLRCPSEFLRGARTSLDRPSIELLTASSFLLWLLRYFSTGPPN